MFKSLFRKSENAFPSWPGLPVFIGGIARGRNRDTFIVSTFSLLGRVASIENKVLPADTEVVRAFARDVLHLREEEELIALKVFQKSTHGKGDVERYTERFLELFIGQPRALRALIDTLVYFATLHGDLNDAARKLIVSVCEAFGFATEDFEKLRKTREQARVTAIQNREELEEQAMMSQKRLRRKYKQVTTSTIEGSYNTLGLSPRDEVEAIKKRYQRLVFDEHPDRVAVKERDPAKLKQARERFQQILLAYQEIRRERKF